MDITSFVGWTSTSQYNKYLVESVNMLLLNSSAAKLKCIPGVGKAVQLPGNGLDFPLTEISYHTLHGKLLFGQCEVNHYRHLHLLLSLCGDDEISALGCCGYVSPLPACCQ